MNKKTKLSLALGAIVITGVAIGTMATSDSSDLQGRFGAKMTEGKLVEQKQNVTTQFDLGELMTLEATLNSLAQNINQYHDQAYNSYLIGTMSGLEEVYAQEQMDIIEDVYESMIPKKSRLVTAMNSIEEIYNNTNGERKTRANDALADASELFNKTLEIEGYYVDLQAHIDATY